MLTRLPRASCSRYLLRLLYKIQLNDEYKKKLIKKQNKN